MSRSPRLLLWATLAWLSLHGAALCAAPIDAIHFEGNEHTREEVLRQELLVHEGEEADAALIEQSRLALMNLGLFKTVATRLEEVDGLLRLTFSMEERFFFLPIPRIGVRAKNGDAQEGVGSYTYGLELRYDNMFGLNHRLKVVHERETPSYDGGNYKREGSLTYSVPRFIGSAYRLDLSGKQIEQEVFEYTDGLNTGHYRSLENHASFTVSRWLDRMISRGWSAGVGMSYSDLDYYEQSGSGLDYTDNFTIAANLGINYSDKQEYEYHRSGQEYGYSISVALPQLGSDNSFTSHYLFHRRYLPLEFANSNLNTQLRLYSTNSAPDSFAIGNSNLLRGYDDDYARGNAMLIANVEYHHHMSGYRQLRGVLFADLGNTWETARDIDLGHLLSSVGVGLRWRVQSFVDVTLRMDYGYALESGTDKLTLNTKASF